MNMATTQLPIDGVFDTETGKLVGFDAGSGAVAELDVAAAQSRVDGDVWVTDPVFGGPVGSDWTQVFIAAVAQASPASKRVWVPPGEYVVNSASFTSENPIVMAGEPGLSVIKRTAAIGSVSYLFNSPVVSLHGLTFDFNSENVSANQWGVLANRAGCDFTSSACTYKNNSGTLGSGVSVFAASGTDKSGSVTFLDNEVYGCSWNALGVFSKCNVRIERNIIHDNSGAGLYVASYLSASSTNYSSGVIVNSNKVYRNGTGIQAGGFGPPYNFTVPPLRNCIISGNELFDNNVNVVLQGHDIKFIGNKIYRDDPGIACNAALFCNAMYCEILNNDITVGGAAWGIDIGGSTSCSVDGNTVRMSAGACLNVGGTDDCKIQNNNVYASGASVACQIYDIEGDGNGVFFPTLTSGLLVKGNSFRMSGAGSRGVNLTDDAGGGAGKTATAIYDNDFYLSNSASHTFAVNAVSQSARVFGNRVGGVSNLYINPDANGDIVYSQVYDEVTTFSGSGTTPLIRAVVSTIQAQAGGQTSIFYVRPTSGGTGYTSQTTLSASGGGSGFSAQPCIIGGVIVAVRVTARGTGYSGAVTITATDPGGGTGAVFSVTKLPGIFFGKRLTLSSSSDINVVRNGGGVVTLGSSDPFVLAPSSKYVLEATPNGLIWGVSTLSLPTLTTAQLPAPSANTVGCKTYIRGSVTNKFLASSTSSSWVFTDGSAVP